MNALEFIKKLEKQLNCEAKEVPLEEIKLLNYKLRISFSLKDNKLIGLKIQADLSQDLPINIQEFSDSLEVLNLFDNYLSNSNIQVLRSLRSLKWLSLDMNRISDISALKDLTNLRWLNLSSNLLENVNDLKKLKDLIRLSLDHNKLQDISGLDNLTNITSLDLRMNKQLIDISGLSNLKNLKELHLNNNKLKSIKELSDLTNLTILELSSNSLKDISVLSNLKDLKKLDLSGNLLKDISVLSNLKNLKKLNLNYNSLHDISALKDLKNLSFLNLNGNKIKNIYVLKNLKNLNSLELGSNLLSNVMVLKDLRNLTFIYLAYNQINNIPILSNLENLEALYLSNNQIDNIKSLKDFKHLTRLDLSFNKIQESSISSDFINYLNSNKSNLHLGIDNNPFINEIEGIKKEDYKTHKNHISILIKDYELFAENKEELTENVLSQKLVLLGNSNSGKSSLLNYLVHNKLASKNTRSTDLLNIVNWKEEDVNYNIYDFGGQDYFHGIYKMFFSENSYYIILWSQDNNYNHIQLDTSEERKIQYYGFDVNYWLYNIKYHTSLLSKQKENSQWYKNIFFVENKIEKIFTPSYSLCVDKQFLAIEEFKISLKEESNGFNEIRRTWLKNYLKHLPQNTVKDTLTRNNAVLFFSKFLQEEMLKTETQLSWSINELFNVLMAKDKDGWSKLDDNLTEQSEKERILNRFNNSGDILWYANIESLKNTVWLQPIKVQQEIVKILANKGIIKDENNNLRHGKIPKNVFEHIVTDKMLRDLMIQKKIIFTDGLKSEPTYIIPQ